MEGIVSLASGQSAIIVANEDKVARSKWLPRQSADENKKGPCKYMVPGVALWANITD